MRTASSLDKWTAAHRANAPKPLAEQSDDEFRKTIEKRRRDRMAKIDSLSPGLRSCVHDYGWNVVNAIMLLGITKPNQIRHIVETVLNEFSPTRGASSSQGIRRAVGISRDLDANGQSQKEGE